MATPSDSTRVSADDDRTAMPSSSPATAATSSADAAGEPTVLALPIGTRLNEFEITGIIGEGGFGIVYAAHDHSLDRAVALKEYMPGALATRTQGVAVSVRSNRHRETFDLGLRSFVNEARLLARFDHPSLVKVYRFWEAHGTAYMVMPHYQGETLKDRLKNTATPPDEAWLRTLLASLLEALDVIHHENVFHRDIAPDNILLLEEDVPVLLDFGAARRVIGDATQGLTVILKPGYAPVEQYAEVKSMKQGAWTDIYALAATMHFAIHGKSPEPAVARMLSDTFVPMVASARGRYSEGFLAAMDAALRVKPEDRPQNVAAFRALLGAPAPAPASPRAPVGEPAAGDARARRSSMPMIAGALALIAALGVGGYFYYAQRDALPTVSPPPEPIAKQAPTAPPPEAVKPPVQPEVSKPPPETANAPDIAPAVPPPPPPEVAKPPTVEPNPPAVAAKSAPVVAKPPPGVDERPVVRADARAETKPAAPKPPPAAKANPDLDQQAYRQPEAPRDNVQVTAWVAQAQQSLARREFRRAIAFADSALSLDPANAQARDIRRRAQEGEKRAFDEIKIE